MVVSPVRLYLAQGLRFGRPSREEAEQIRPVEVPLAEAVEAVMGGRITHGPSCVLVLKAHHFLHGGKAT
jgi:ADP-ribose pyrophosphatase